MKKVAGTMRLDLAQYRELEAFAQFGSELDAASQRQLQRGERTVEVLKQPQYQPVPVAQQIITIYAVTGGHLDDVPVPDVRRFERELREHMETRHSSLIEGLASDGKLGDDRIEEIKGAIEEFRSSFQVSTEGDEEEHVTLEALDTLSDAGGDDAPDQGQGDGRGAEDEMEPISETNAPPPA
jgi:F-type H+-transporting ATPase subunit alpha